MAKKRFQAEQIIGKLREAEVEISKGQTIGQVAKKLGVSLAQVYLARHRVGRLLKTEVQRLRQETE